MESSPKKFSLTPTPISAETTNAGSSKSLLSFLVVAEIITLAVACYFGYQYYQPKNETVAQIQPAASETPQPTTSPAATPASTDIKWVSANYGGAFSYEYPYGWNVAELWPTSQNQGATIAIDPKPINNAPRGGPLATFTITVINGLQNPDEEFNNRKASFNSDVYSDITTEVLSGDLGPIYYFKGKMKGEMANGQPVESYYLTFNPFNGGPQNQQIVIAEMVFKDDPQLSSMLRHIVLSIKKQNH